MSMLPDMDGPYIIRIGGARASRENTLYVVRCGDTTTRAVSNQTVATRFPNAADARSHVVLMLERGDAWATQARPVRLVGRLVITRNQAPSTPAVEATTSSVVEKYLPSTPAVEATTSSVVEKYFTTGGHAERVVAFLNATPTRFFTAAEMGPHVGIANMDSLRTTLSVLAAEGEIVRGNAKGQYGAKALAKMRPES